MATPAEVHLRHLLDVAKVLQPVDDALAHFLTHRATRQAVAATGKVDYMSITIGIRGGYVRDMSTGVGAECGSASAMSSSHQWS